MMSDKQRLSVLQRIGKKKYQNPLVEYNAKRFIDLQPIKSRITMKEGRSIQPDIFGNRYQQVQLQLNRKRTTSSLKEKLKNVDNKKKRMLPTKYDTYKPIKNYLQ